jgi:6-phosphogluconolactonase (cycloisomerase 2 family)
MKRTAKVLAAIVALSASVVLAQSSGPVAYIYVSTNDSGSNNKVVGFAASADGTLSKIAGSPWDDNLSYLATNGSYLFGSTNIATDNGKNIFSYKVESNGALKYIGATNIQDDGTENACNIAENPTLDHTGSYLYAYVENAGGCADAGDSYGAVQSFSVNKSTGLLNYVAVTGTTSPGNYLPLSMLADNNYAYTPGEYGSGISTLQKNANGSIDFISSASANIGDEGMPSGWGWGYAAVTADPTNHLAADVIYSADGCDYGCAPDTEDKIATLTVNTSNGSQTTNSSFSNMATTDVTYVNTLAMSPSGTLLAVAGYNGVQIFNFNPNGQATVNTGLITTERVSGGYTSQLYWDKNNHLYVISSANNALHVFNVTATGTTEAPGSPYTITNPVAITGHSM